MENNLLGRVDDLESKYHDHDKEIALMRQTQQDMREDIKAMRNNTSRLVWIVLAGVVGLMFNAISNGWF